MKGEIWQCFSQKWYDRIVSVLNRLSHSLWSTPAEVITGTERHGRLLYSARPITFDSDLKTHSLGKERHARVPKASEGCVADCVSPVSFLCPVQTHKSKWSGVDSEWTHDVPRRRAPSTAGSPHERPYRVRSFHMVFINTSCHCVVRRALKHTGPNEDWMKDGLFGRDVSNYLWASGRTLSVVVLPERHGLEAGWAAPSPQRRQPLPCS